MENACGWTPWASSGERSAKGNPRELLGVEFPSELSLVSVDPLKDVSPYIGLFRVQCDRDMLLRGRGGLIVPPRTLHKWCL